MAYLIGILFKLSKAKPCIKDVYNPRIKDVYNPCIKDVYNPRIKDVKHV